MTPAVDHTARSQVRVRTVIWFAVFAVACYAPVLGALIRQWNHDPDMGHGFFVPLVAGFIAWRRRKELAVLKPQPNWKGLILVLWGAVQMLVGTLGVERFLVRTAFVITLIGMIWMLCGTPILRKVAFPLFLLFFMVPIPAVIYNPITFRLQLLASYLADQALTLFNVPVLREGNVLELPTQRLSVVDACSGIRSLLSLTFLSLVYGYFFEKRVWMRVVLFFSTVPIALIANASRVTLTGILSYVKPEYAEGFFHEAEGWVIFMAGLIMLIIFHQVFVQSASLLAPRRAV